MGLFHIVMHRLHKADGDGKCKGTVGIPDHDFGMPLESEYEWMPCPVNRFDGLDNPVGGKRGCPESGCDQFHGLVVAAVYKTLFLSDDL